MRGSTIRFLPLAAAIALLLGVVACAPSDAGGDDDDGFSPTTTPTSTPVDGIHLTADTTWSGVQSVTDDTIVDPGVTLTIDAGTVVSFAGGTQLRVEGTLVVNGTSGSHVSMEATAPASKWSGVKVAAGGTAELHHVDFTNATSGFTAEVGAGLSRLFYASFSAIGTPMTLNADTKVCRGSFGSGSGTSTANAGAIAIADTDFVGGSGGDAFVFGGTAAVSIVNAHFGTSWHCLLHGGAAGVSLSITGSIFDDAAYAFMISGVGSVGNPATIHQCSIPIGTLTGGVDSGSGNTVDASNNYWGSSGGWTTPPAGWTVEPHLTSAPAGAGPRAPGNGCESDPQF